MIDREIKATLDTIKGSKNPEIHHFNYGSHPGIKFYIKTILPGPIILNDNTHKIWKFWKDLSIQHSKLIILVERAYDWQGNRLRGWWTIWLNQKIDIIWSYSEENGFDYNIVDYEIGLKHSADKSLSWFDTLTDRHHPDDILCYEQLEEVASFLKSYTSEKSANLHRTNLKVLENDKISDETINRK